MRVVQKETYPLKILVKDCLIVFASVIVGNFVIEQLTPTLGLIDDSTKASLAPSSPAVFLENPDF